MIRMAAEPDIPAILDIYAPYVENTVYSFEYSAPTLPVFTQRFQTITERFPWLVWEEDGKVLGYAYGSAPFHRAAYNWCAEVSIYIAPSAQGKGIGRRLYAALEQLLALQGFQVVYSIVTSGNSASLAFHKAVGYRFLAEFPACGFKHNRWHGIIWLEKRLSSVDIPTQMPIPWKDFVKNHRNLANILDILTLS